MNLRTNKEWDLNPPPLTKLGDPRAELTAQSLSFQINAYDMAVNPAALINWIISPIDIFSDAVIIPESDSWEILAPVMCSFAIKTLVNLDEHPPHVIPTLNFVCVMFRILLLVDILLSFRFIIFLFCLF